MKLDTQITVLFSADGLHLKVTDKPSGVTFLDITMNAAQVCQAFSRLSNVQVTECEIKGLDKIGKRHEHKSFTVTIPGDIDYNTRQEIARQKLLEECPEGWVPDLYLGSQNSFSYNYKTKQTTVTTFIRRWVEEAA